MRSQWLITLFASASMIAAALALHGCGGVGGPQTDTGGLPSVTQQFLALLGVEQRSATNIGSEACADCHGGKNPDDPIYAHWKDTVHAEKGVTCERCHGPGSAHQAAPSKENILTFPKSTSPIVCAQCHGPTHDQFNFSAHVKLIASPVERGVTSPSAIRSSACMSCHSGLFRTMVHDKEKKLADLTDDEIKWIAENTITGSPHSASCVTCHNPHAKTGNLTDEGKEVMLRKKNFNTDTTNVAPGTTPEQFVNFDHGCAQCHNGRGTNPADNRLEAGTARPSMHDSNQYNMLMGFGAVEGSGPVQRNTAHATAPGQCTKCHMPDSRHTFTVSYDKGCAPCHTAADAAARAGQVKSEILGLLVALRTRMEGWARTNLGDEDFWDYTSVIQGEGKTPPNQANVPIEIKRARHNYYFVIRSGDYGTHNAPYAKHIIGVANTNLDALNAPQAGASRLSNDEKFRLIENHRKRANQAEMSLPENQ